MKKFLLSLVAVLSTVGAWAEVTDLPQITTDVNNPIYYTIYNTRSSQPGGLMYYAGDEVGLKDGCQNKLSLEDKYKFYFTGSHDAMYVHNAATGKKLASVTSWTDEGAEWAVGVSPKGGGLAVGPKGGLNGGSCWNEKNFATDANTSDFTTWSANDAGSIFVFEPADQYVFPEADKIYTIEAPLFEKAQGVKKGLYVTSDGALNWGTVDPIDKNYLWVATVNTDGTRVFKNLATEKYIGGSSMSDTEVAVTIKALGSNQFNLVAGGTTMHANNHANGSGASGNIVNWSGSAGSASAWSFVEHADPDAVTHVTVIYNFMYNGVSKGTQTVELLDGDEYPAITASLPWGIGATKPEGTIQAADAVDGVVTKTIELVETTPFVCAESFDAVATWYYFKIRPEAAHNNLLYYDATQEYLNATKQSADYDNVDVYAWAFVGNPFDGFQIVNKAAGSSMSLTSPEPTADKTFPVLGEGAQVWDFSASPSGTDGFYIAYHGTNKRMNKQDGKVCYWLGGADIGSTFTVEAIDMSGGADLISELDKAKVLQAAIGTAVGNIDAESAADLNTAIANAEAALTAGTGGFACINPLKAAMTKLTTVQPNPSAYYRIVSSCTRDHRAGQFVYVGNDGAMYFENAGNSATTLGYVFQFEDAGDGKFYMYNVERGVYAKSFDDGAWANVFDSSNAKKVTITNKGESNIVTIQPEGENMMHAQDAGSRVVAWQSDELDGASAWKIEEVDITTASHPVTIGETGYATLCLGYDAAIPENVEAYAVSAIEEEKATLTELNGVIPANCAVVLKGAAATYDFAIAGTSATAPTNMLQGTVLNTNITPEGTTSYVLSAEEGVAGLYKAALDQAEGTAFQSKAFEAYMLVNTADAKNSYIFVIDPTTGITSIQGAENGNAVIYDLSGRRVQKTVKGGLYIKAGAKYVQK